MLLFQNNYDYLFGSNNVLNAFSHYYLTILLLILLIGIIKFIVRITIYSCIKKTASTTESFHRDFITLANSLDEQNKVIISHLENISNTLKELKTSDSENNNIDEYEFK